MSQAPNNSRLSLNCMYSLDNFSGLDLEYLYFFTLLSENNSSKLGPSTLVPEDKNLRSTHCIYVGDRSLTGKKV
ncbi:hypothetical protein [Diadegma fenestrale ichnovirus]|nr:hypothetical protein [Diadegma fenestrale ichnovirus]